MNINRWLIVGFCIAMIGFTATYSLIWNGKVELAKDVCLWYMFLGWICLAGMGVCWLKQKGTLKLRWPRVFTRS